LGAGWDRLHQVRRRTETTDETIEHRNPDGSGTKVWITTDGRGNTKTVTFHFNSSGENIGTDVEVTNRAGRMVAEAVEVYNVGKNHADVRVTWERGRGLRHHWRINGEQHWNPGRLPPRVRDDYPTDEARDTSARFFLRLPNGGYAMCTGCEQAGMSLHHHGAVRQH
jgi:hypothetical protein